MGLVCGLGLLAMSRKSFLGIDSADPSRGILIAGISLVGRLFLTTALLFVYSRYVPEGIAPFGLVLAGSFLLGYMVELVRYAGLHRYVRPSAGHRDGR